MDKLKLINKIKRFPEAPGVYIMRDSHRAILYIGKATSLRHHILSYFQQPPDTSIKKILSQLNIIDIRKTDSVIEAFLLESKLIKKYEPKYNVKLRNSKTYLGILVTKEDWPRVLPARPHRLAKHGGRGEFYGPFTSKEEVGEILQALRKIFPFRVSCQPLSGKACLEYHLGMCPGVCAGKLTKKEYQKTIQSIKMFLSGRKKEVIKSLTKEMRQKSKNLDFEKAAKIRDQIFALKHL